MKKVRDLPPECSPTQTQTSEYQEHLCTLVAEEKQATLAKRFMGDKEDDDLPLAELDYQILADCTKSIPDNLDEKHSIWEEGDEVCYAYGRLTLRGIIRWGLKSGKVGKWLMAELTDEGKRILTEHEGVKDVHRD